MTQTRVQFHQIGSYQPAVDYRKTGVIGVLSGRNFAWDAAGVGAAFGTRLVSDSFSIGDQGYAAYELRVGDMYHVAVGENVWKLNPGVSGSPTGVWEQVATLANVQQPSTDLVPEKWRGFTADFLGGQAYVCSWNNGVYRVAADDTYTRLTSGTVPGFPLDSEPIIAICETNGRMLYMSEETLYWSAPASPEDLVPALGGAGFQIIAERISGEPRALTPIHTGAIIWTTAGALVAEFVGGDQVFRFYELSSNVLPLTQSACVKMPTNTYVVLSRLGLYAVVSAQIPEPITPLFNEFIREYLRTRKMEVAHLWYTQADNRMFLSLKTDNGLFFETFVLDVGLDRWGILNDLHLGMFHYTDQRSPFAYLNPQGIVSYLLPARDPNKNKENPFAPGTYGGLGSQVTIGFIRAENMVPTGDALQELQEVVVYRQQPIEGYLTTYVDEGLTTDNAYTTVDEGLVTAASPEIFDEGFVGEGNPPTSYGLEMITDLFSPEESLPNNFNSSPMALARKGTFADVWTGNLPSFHFQLKFTASEDGEYFRINAMDCTLSYAGQLI